MIRSFQGSLSLWSCTEANNMATAAIISRTWKVTAVCIHKYCHSVHLLIAKKRQKNTLFISTCILSGFSVRLLKARDNDTMCTVGIFSRWNSWKEEPGNLSVCFQSPPEQSADYLSGITRCKCTSVSAQCKCAPRNKITLPVSWFCQQHFLRGHVPGKCRRAGQQVGQIAKYYLGMRINFFL